MEKSRQENIRVGLFGGTFDPIHLGHLRSAEEIREQFNIAKVFFIPAHLPPHKKSVVLSSEHRFKMVKLGIRGNPCFYASDIELRRPGKSYSFETICQFHGNFKAYSEIFFIMGIDTFREIKTWKDYPHLFSTCNFIIMTRPGFPVPKHLEQFLPHDIHREFHYQPGENFFVHKSGHIVYFNKITMLEISSTTIRTKVREGKSIRYLVPEAVERYIAKNRLYASLDK